MCRILKIRQKTASHSASVEYSAKLPNIRRLRQPAEYYSVLPYIKGIGDPKSSNFSIMLKMKLYVCRNLCENIRQIQQKNEVPAYTSRVVRRDACSQIEPAARRIGRVENVVLSKLSFFFTGEHSVLFLPCMCYVISREDW